MLTTGTNNATCLRNSVLRALEANGLKEFVEVATGKGHSGSRKASERLAIGRWPDRH
jgi:hypothetical protein